MKKLLLLLLTLFPTVLFAENYTVAKAANVRSGAGTQYDVIGGVNQGDTLAIAEITGAWGRLGDGDGGGYVALELLEPLPAVGSEVGLSLSTAGQWVSANPKTTTLISLIVLVLAAILFLQFTKKMNTTYYVVGIASVLLVCGLEYFYFFHLGGDSWFCEPKFMGLWIAGLNSLLFALFFAAQLFLFFTVFSDLVALQDYEPNYTVGLIAFPVAFLVILGSLFFRSSMDTLFHYTWLGLIVAQGVQALILLVQLWRTPWLAVAVSSAYCLCVGVVLTLFAKMVWVLLAACVLLLVIGGIFSGRSGSSGQLIGHYKDKQGKKWEVRKR